MSERVNIGVRLLTHTIEALDAAGERLGGRSRAFVIEVLTAMYVESLTPDMAIPMDLMPPGARLKKTAKPKKGGGKK